MRALFIILNICAMGPSESMAGSFHERAGHAAIVVWLVALQGRW
jgi:hypothetical protein